MNRLIATTTLAVLPLAGIGQTLIDFDSYALGNLAGQTTNGVSWTRTNGPTAPTIIEVQAGVGVGGSQGIVGRTGASGNFTFYGFDTNLGPAFNSSSSVVDYSFQWKPTQDLDGGGQSIFTLALGSSANAGGNGALKLNIAANGNLVAETGGGNQTATGLFTTNQFALISGTADFGSNTFTVFVNGVQQFTGVNGGSLAFVNSGADNVFIRVGNLTATDPAVYRTWVADDISVVPEPSTYALLAGLATLIMVGLRRRAKAQAA